MKCFFICFFQWLLLTSQSSNVSQALKKISDIVNEEIEMGNTPGAVLALNVGDDSFVRAYGVKGVRNKIDLDTKSYFKIASTAKVFMGYAILKLCDQGELKLEDKIGKYLNDVDEVIRNVTIKQLLSHTSGLGDGVQHNGSRGVSQHLRFAKRQDESLKYTEPGIIFSYSNIGYNILGALIEKVTDKEYNQAIRELVFNDFGMSTTTYRMDELNEDDIAFGHSISGNNKLNQINGFDDNAEERASGGALSNAEEINRFMRWFTDDVTTIHPEIRKKMLNGIASTSMTGSDWEYGYGLFLSKQCGHEAIWHTGGVPGFKSNIFAIPEKKFSIAIYTNGPRLDRWKIINTAAEELLGVDCTNNFGDSGVLIDFSIEEKKELEGYYSQGYGGSIKLFIENPQGKLMLQREHFRKYEVKKSKDGKIIALENGEERGSYSIFRDNQNKIRYLQNWVRAYPKIN